MGRENVARGVPLSAYLTREQEKQLRELGKQVDNWNSLVEECGGDPKLAEVLEALRRPDNEKPRVKGSSLRVAGQRHANNRP